MYSTVVSDVGTVRSNNQDSAFAGEHLIAICDGMGGHAGGDTASTIAIRSLAHIEQDNVDGDVQVVSHMMATSVMAAHDAIVGKAKRERRLAGMGTTVTSVALVAGCWVLAHIGDSRAYLLHDGHLVRMTSDHSYVQHLIDTGRISEAEARNHPQRNVVMRVLGDFDIDSRPDIAIRKAHPSDRWLLCSDGLCGVLEDSTLEEVLSTCADQEECAQRLVSMALRAGSTDNVTAVIADATLALDADAFDLPHQTPLIGGAASASLETIADIVNEPVASAPPLREGKQSPAARAAALRSGKDPNEEPKQPEQRVAQPSSVREDNGDRVNTDTGEIPIVQKRNTKRPMNPYRIAALVAEISGREVEIYENVAPHTYEVIIRPGSSNVDLAAVAEEIYKVKQSQKHVRIVFETPVRLQVRSAGMNFSFRHIIAGTRPDVNRPGALQPLEVDVAPQATGQAFAYPTPGEEKRAGTYPDVSTIGEMTAPGVNARITGESAGIVYKICGATRL